MSFYQRLLKGLNVRQIKLTKETKERLQKVMHKHQIKTYDETVDSLIDAFVYFEKYLEEKDANNTRRKT